MNIAQHSDKVFPDSGDQGDKVRSHGPHTWTHGLVCRAASAVAPGLREAVVTATKTGATAAQKTPVALTVLTAEQLETSGVINVTDLSQRVPSLTIPMVTIIPQI